MDGEPIFTQVHVAAGNGGGSLYSFRRSVVALDTHGQVWESLDGGPWKRLNEFGKEKD